MSKFNIKINIIFLILAILFSIISKIFQFIFNSKLGDIIIIPAGILFILAIVFSIPKFIELKNNKSTKKIAYIIAGFSCAAMFFFQIMMILLIGNKNFLGLVFLIPIILSIFMVIRYYSKTKS